MNCKAKKARNLLQSRPLPATAPVAVARRAILPSTARPAGLRRAILPATACIVGVHSAANRPRRPLSMSAMPAHPAPHLLRTPAVPPTGHSGHCVSRQCQPCRVEWPCELPQCVPSRKGARCERRQCASTPVGTYCAATYIASQKGAATGMRSAVVRLLPLLESLSLLFLARKLAVNAQAVPSR